jgi:hypothetical protein
MPPTFSSAARLPIRNASVTTSRATPLPTHRCVRCGAEISVADALCRACNPDRLAQPSASQAHGTVFVGIAGAVVALAVVASFFVGGVGPFSVAVRGVTADGSGLLVRLEVTNNGSRAGHATCRLWDPTRLGNPPVETFIRSPEIGAGQTVAFEQHVTRLGQTERPLAATCSR